MVREDGLLKLHEYMRFIKGTIAEKYCGEALRMAIEALQQPERKKGKWIYGGDCYICDQCKSAFGWWADSQTSNYCPNCGADMRGEQNE